MPRPCYQRHVLSPGQCNYCRHCVKDDPISREYRYRWKEPEPTNIKNKRPRSDKPRVAKGKKV